MATHGGKTRVRTRAPAPRPRAWMARPRVAERSLGVRNGLLAEYLPEIVWTTTADGANDFCNQHWHSYTGMSAEETQGDGWIRAVHPDDMESVRVWWRGCVKGTRFPVMRYRLRRADGEYRWHLVRASAMRDAAGNIVRWVGNLVDIHEQVAVEKELRLSDARYRDLVEMSQDAIYIRSEGKFVFANAATARMFGVESPAALIGKSPLGFVHPDFVEGLKRRWAALETHRKPLPPYHLKLIRGDGTMLDVESIVSPIEFDGRIAAHVVIRDISERLALERKQLDLIREQAAHAQAAAHAAHFRLLAEAVPNMVWMSSADGRLEYVNNRMLDYLGCDFDGLAGRKWTRFVHDDDLAGVTSQWTESLASGKALEVEERLRRRDGIFRWHLVRALPVRDERGRIDRWVGTCVDIDDQKQAQVLLKSSRERLETAVTLRTQELVKANAALRASEEKLRKLSAHLQSAREAERTAVAREIHDELGALLTAVKMDLARYLRNCHDMPQASQDLLTGVAALVDTSIQTLRRIATQLRPSILDHLGLWPALEWQLDEFQNRYGVRCHIEFNAMPSGLAKDAQTALFRIVQEALTNVARHAQATRVRLIVGEADGCAAIEIVDDGVGIPPEKLSDPTSCGIQGMHERAEAFGGRITLKSTRGGGTRIFIRFPLLEVAHQAIAGEVA